MVVDHDHMHILLSFVSGLGPRKAKNLIQILKSQSVRLHQRNQLFLNYMTKTIGNNCCAFFKFRLPYGERSKVMQEAIDVMDQTRIHPESYAVTYKFAKDALMEGDSEQDMIHKQLAIKKVMANPSHLKKLDIQSYNSELERSGMSHLTQLVDYIIQELENPFKDPRAYRTHDNLDLTNERLFYMLIDESPRTFKRGMIVTATVTKVLDTVVFCKLDNGLDASVQK